MALPLEQEIARLRADGFSDDAIKDHFAAQRNGSSPNATGGPYVQPPFSGPLANANAVFSHARAKIPGLKQDAATVLNRASKPGARAKSLLTLSGVAVLIAALGYVVYQEVIIHIVNAPPTSTAQRTAAEEQAAAAHAQSC